MSTARLTVAQALVRFLAVSEGVKLIVVIIQNHGFSSIGALSESLGSQRFGTSYRYRDPDSGVLDGGTGTSDDSEHERARAQHCADTVR